MAVKEFLLLLSGWCIQAMGFGGSASGRVDGNEGGGFIVILLREGFE